MATKLYQQREQNLSESSLMQSQNQCKKLMILMGVYVFIVLNIFMSGLTIGLVVFLNDFSRQFKQVFGYAEATVLITLNLIQLFILISRKYQFMIPMMIILSICGVIVGMFMGILQISEQSLSENGSGRIPLVDPHNEFWYQINMTNTILTYTVAITILIQESLVYLLFKSHQPEDKSEMGDDPLLNFQLDSGCSHIYEQLESDQKIYEKDSSQGAGSQQNLQDEQVGSVNVIKEPLLIPARNSRGKILSSLTDNIINSVPSRNQKAKELLQQNLQSFSLGSEKPNTVEQKYTIDCEQSQIKGSLGLFYPKN